MISNNFPTCGNCVQRAAEDRPYNGIEEVVGSIPSGSTNFNQLMSLALSLSAAPALSRAIEPSSTKEGPPHFVLWKPAPFMPSPTADFDLAEGRRAWPALGARSRDFPWLSSRLSLRGLDRPRDPGARDEQGPHDVPALARFCAYEFGPHHSHDWTPARLSALEINLTPLLTVIGAAGFVVAFALQGTLSNFASGLLIMAFKPFDVGDEVEVGSGIKGKVSPTSPSSAPISTPMTGC